MRLPAKAEDPGCEPLFGDVNTKQIQKFKILGYILTDHEKYDTKSEVRIQLANEALKKIKQRAEELENVH